MDKKKILIQIDSDPQASAFDRIVATDAGVDVVYSYSAVRLEHLQSIVHGAIFTRGNDDLHNTAIFIGGSELGTGDFFFNEIRKHMIPQFGLQVSVMLDSNGANTTGAAAVHVASKHLDLKSTTALIVGGTGPVGQRIARLLARAGADVRIGSRTRERAEAIALGVRNLVPQAKISAVATSSATDGPAALEGVQLVIATGAAGVVLLPKKIRDTCPTLKMAIDLNAVPPAGIEGIETTDKGTTRDSIICYGSIGVGGTKMKLHRAAVAKLFTFNDLSIDAEQVYELVNTI
jgi:methylenetetrahydrofolate/methylenetetrahydromethanopterin dehydrogenase (NADP+)